ncbi:MAG: prephenate dehydrogenase/arogenate dehydrogenase family protein [Agathobacter sp.]|nr:prephenate dehydrogenase/arogenate dehydrogenase family protein [Agathobacter sp.]
MAFQKIGFIGLGLIGGSIAKKIKSNIPDCTIVATAGHQSTIQTAYDEGLISNSSLLDFADFSDCDHIFLCAPVNRNIEYLSVLKSIIRPDCIITDVGSTKSEIHKAVITLGLEHNFIGGHPMTGSEKTGITNANASILENAYYIITPTAHTTSEQLEEFRSFVQSLGSIPLVLDYETHDYATASISHLPHMIAFSLVNLVQEIDDNQETMKTIAAGGFRDITRVASSSPIMWENICASNRTQIVKLMDLYVDKLSYLRSLLVDYDSDRLMEFFQSAKNYRDSMFIPGRKTESSVYEIYLDLADEAGEIAIIANLLAYKGVSIKNIGIIHNREFEEGVLRVEFYDQNALDHAIVILEERNYKVYKR